MTTWFTSDTHFNHRNILRYTNRPFDSIQEMNETIIHRWNERIGQNDHVYFLGDLSFGSPDDTLAIVKRLNGKKYWIRGNHDKKIRNDLAKQFKWIRDYYKLHVQDQDHPRGRQTIILFHYPIAQWDEMFYGNPSWALHGHCHNNYWTKFDLTIDVGVDAQNYYPISYEEVKEIMQQRIQDRKFHEHQAAHGVYG